MRQERSSCNGNAADGYTTALGKTHKSRMQSKKAKAKAKVNPKPKAHKARAQVACAPDMTARCVKVPETHFNALQFEYFICIIRYGTKAGGARKKSF